MKAKITNKTDFFLNLQTMLDPNVSVEPLDSTCDLTAPVRLTGTKPELTIYF